MLRTVTETAFFTYSWSIGGIYCKKRIAVFLHTAEFIVKTLSVSFQTVLISSHCAFYTTSVITTVIFILLCLIVYALNS
jgi:hypothetical protein